jgi:hypothetical protein
MTILGPGANFQSLFAETDMKQADLQLIPKGSESADPSDRICARRWRASDLAVAITALVLLTAVLVTLLPQSTGVDFTRFTPEQLALVGTADSTSVRNAHRAAILMLGLLCVLAAQLICRPVAPGDKVLTTLRSIVTYLKRSAGLLLFIAGALVLLLNLQYVTFPGPVGRRLRLLFLLASALTAILLLVLARSRKTSAFQAAIGIFTAAYCLFLITPGLVRLPTLSEPLSTAAEWHYSFVIGPADRLAAGLQLGSHVNLYYGVIPSLLLAAFERNWGLLDFGGHVRLVQFFQIAFLALALLAYWLWRPRNLLFVLFGALLVGPWISTSHMAIFHPNQSGWRSLGMAAGIVVLLLVQRQPLRRAAFILGAAGMFVLLYNTETGVCLSVGYGLFLLSRAAKLTVTGVFELAGLAVAGAILLFLPVPIFYRITLGSWPTLAVEPLLVYIRRFSEGYAALPLYFDPLALLIGIHCVYLIASCVMKWRLRHLDSREGINLAISATLLVWFTYFLNRPHPWNLWTFQFLYAFLFADVLDWHTLRSLTRRNLTGIVLDWKVAALAFVVLPVVLSNNYFAMRATIHPDGQPLLPSTMRTISGISMAETSANLLQGKANFLLRQDASTLFISRQSYSLSLLTQRFNPLRTQDAFTETVTNQDFEDLVAEIYALSPRLILFDAPDSESLMPEYTTITIYMRFFDRLKARLGERYRHVAVTDGWEVLELRQLGRRGGLGRAKAGSASPGLSATPFANRVPRSDVSGPKQRTLPGQGGSGQTS